MPSHTNPAVCAHCGVPAERRDGGVWCRRCKTWLVLHAGSGQWVTFAERQNRHQATGNARHVAISRLLAAMALPAVAQLLPHRWRASTGQNLPGATYTIGVYPPGDRVDVTAYLYPPVDRPGWYVRVHNRYQGIDFPLYTDGGTQAASYPILPEAVTAAVTAVRIERA